MVVTDVMFVPGVPVCAAAAAATAAEAAAVAVSEPSSSPTSTRWPQHVSGLITPE